MARPKPNAEKIDFEQLYIESRDDLYAYIASMVRDASLAEEVTATAFERAFRKRGSYKPRLGSPRAWLFVIARNAALDELRRLKRRAVLSFEVSDQLESDQPGEIQQIDRISLLEALTELTPQERELIMLKFYSGLGNQEIAQTVGISETNISTRICRTVTKLREVLNEAE